MYKTKLFGTTLCNCQFEIWNIDVVRSYIDFKKLKRHSYRLYGVLVPESNTTYQQQRPQCLLACVNAPANGVATRPPPPRNIPYSAWALAMYSTDSRSTNTVYWTHKNMPAIEIWRSYMYIMYICMLVWQNCCCTKKSTRILQILYTTARQNESPAAALVQRISEPLTTAASKQRATNQQSVVISDESARDFYNSAKNHTDAEHHTSVDTLGIGEHPEDEWRHQLTDANDGRKRGDQLERYPTIQCTIRRVKQKTDQAHDHPDCAAAIDWKRQRLQQRKIETVAQNLT